MLYVSRERTVHLVATREGQRSMVMAVTAVSSVRPRGSGAEALVMTEVDEDVNGHRGDVPRRALYRVDEATILLSLSRSQLYELIRAQRLQSVREGRTRLIPAEAIREYVALLVNEASGGSAA